MSLPSEHLKVSDYTQSICLIEAIKLIVISHFVILYEWVVAGGNILQYASQLKQVLLLLVLRIQSHSTFKLKY